MYVVHVYANLMNKVTTQYQPQISHIVAHHPYTHECQNPQIQLIIQDVHQG